MKSKKIVFLVQQMLLGGVEKASIMLANALFEKGFEVIIYSVLQSECIVPLSDGVKLFYLSDMIISKEDKIKRLIRKYYELKCIKQIVLELHDVIVISTRNEYSTILSKYSRDTVNIAMLHNDYTTREKYDFMFRYRNIHYFVQLNEKIRDEIEVIMSKHNQYTQVICIPNFLVQTQYSKEKIYKRENIIVSVGGLRKVKGFDRLIDIWSLIAEKYPTWKLIIVGEGNERDILEEKILKYGLSNHIELLGYRDNEQVMELMRKSKIYALPSYKEAFGFVIIEAMQSGLPVVAFDVRTGPSTIIENNKNGFLIPDYDDVLFANSLETIINDEDLRSRLADKALLEAEKYEKDNVIKRWIHILNEAEQVLREQ